MKQATLYPKALTYSEIQARNERWEVVERAERDATEKRRTPNTFTVTPRVTRGHSAYRKRKELERLLALYNRNLTLLRANMAQEIESYK